jgi:hypothetical protein
MLPPTGLGGNTASLELSQALGRKRASICLGVNLAAERLIRCDVSPAEMRGCVA